jgi:molecular chaperone DnaK (HSP70)/HEAT repeat protein
MPVSHKLAIDFGTTNSVIAVWDETANKARLLTVPGLSQQASDGRPPLIPSLVYIQDGKKQKIVLGQAVIDEKLDQKRGNRLFRNLKRGILVSAGKQPRLIDGVPWTEYDAGLFFLKELLTSLPYAPEAIEKLVLTVPVAALDNYLAWLNENVAHLLAENIQLVDESTAAALGYFIKEPGSLVLVFDFGGGSLDLSLVQLPESHVNVGGLLKHLRGRSASNYMARVISKAGVNLGGSDIDHWLLTTALQRIGRSLDDLGDDYAPLLTTCEAAKITLSSQDEVKLDFTIDKQSYAVPLRRSDLEDLLKDNGFYMAVRRVIDKVMHIAHRRGIFREDVPHVLLTGGTCLIPSVQRMLYDYFGEDVVHVEKPFSAVAEGALQIAAGFGLQDYLMHSYGLRYFDPQSGQQRYDEIIPAGSPYPSENPVEVRLGAAHPQQEAVELVIGQVEQDAITNIAVRYEDGQAIFVAQADQETQTVIPINLGAAERLRVPLDPPSEPGVERLLARFYVDDQRHLRLDVIDLHTRKDMLKDVVLGTLGVGYAESLDQFTQRIISQDFSDDNPDDYQRKISGYEPALAVFSGRSEQRLSLRRLGTLLNMLPPDAISLEAAIEAIKSDQFYVRYQAAELLSKRGDRDARRVIEDFLINDTPPQRSAAARHLFRFSWYAAEPLLRRALGDSDVRVRESAVYALCELANPGAYQVLLSALPGDDEALKSAAAWGLSRHSDPASLPVLEICLTARDPEVRSQTLEIMAASLNPAAIPPVLDALDDSDLDVRYAATLSWIELTGEDSFAGLAERIETSQGEIRQVYVNALFHATNYLGIQIATSTAADQVIAALETALQDPHPKVRLSTFMPLAWMQDDRAIQVFLAAYQREEVSDVKTRMLYMAASLIPSVGKEMLQEALDDPDPALRQTARQLLTTHYANPV